jgi:hypothetical protein
MGAYAVQRLLFKSVILNLDMLRIFAIILKKERK